MTPVPVSGLLSAILFVVRAIILMPFYQIASVGVVFAVIPVVVVTVMRIIDSNLNFLRCRSSYNRSARRKSSRQKQRAYKSTCTVHIGSLLAAIPQLAILKSR